VEDAESKAERAERLSQHVAGEAFRHPLIARQDVFPASEPNSLIVNPRAAMRPVVLQRGPQDKDALLTERTVPPCEREHRVLAAVTRSQRDILDTAGYPNASSDNVNFEMPMNVDEERNQHYEVGPHRVRPAGVEGYLLAQSMFSTSVREQARAAHDAHIQGDSESSDSSADRSDYGEHGPPGSGKD